MTRAELADPRIVALVLRASRVGYAVFAGPKQLLDWGIHATPRERKKWESHEAKRIALLFTTFLPCVIVVKNTSQKSGSRHSRSRSIRKLIMREAVLRGKPVVILKEDDVRRALRLLPASTKYDRAVLMASTFPELQWRLPRRRKPWESEPRSMLIFDAIALGYAYWQRDGEPLPAAKSSANEAGFAKE
jgi:hypothetical protein